MVTTVHNAQYLEEYTASLCSERLGICCGKADWRVSMQKREFIIIYLGYSNLFYNVYIMIVSS